MVSPHWLWAVGMMLTLLASSGVSTTVTPRDVVLLLDNSGSMRQNDPQFLTRRAVAEFLRGLTDRTRVAIVIFDQKVRLAAPLTPVTENTRDGLLAKLEIIDYRGRFTNSPAGMERAIYELKRHGRLEAEKIVIFMTDGIVDTGDPVRDRELAKWMHETLAGEAAAAGIRIFGIAFTDAADFQLIQTLTFRTGGTYFRAVAADDIGSMFERLNASLQRTEAPSNGPLPMPSPAATSRPMKPSVNTTSEPEVPAARVIDQPPLSRPPGEVLKAEQPASPSGIEQPTAPKKQPVLKLGRRFAPTPSAPAVTDPLPEVTSPGMSKSMPQWMPTPAILVIFGCGLAVSLALVITALVRRRQRSAFAKAIPPMVVPSTSRYPPPFCLLKDLSGATHRESHDITGRLTRISRTPAEDSPTARTLVVKDDYISREHAIIEYRDYGYWIIDRGSVNGSFVNDERVTSERLLKHGDRLRFHTYEFEVVLPEMEGEAKTQLAQIPFAEDPSVAVGEEDTALVGIQKCHGAEPRRGKKQIPSAEENTPSADPATPHPRE